MTKVAGLLLGSNSAHLVSTVRSYPHYPPVPSSSSTTLQYSPASSLSSCLLDFLHLPSLSFIYLPYILVSNSSFHLHLVSIPILYYFSSISRLPLPNRAVSVFPLLLHFSPGHSTLHLPDTYSASSVFQFQFLLYPPIVISRTCTFQSRVPPL